MADSMSALDLQMNRLDVLSRLAGDLSHEIKNPLHAMVINLELVRRRVEQGQGEGALERVAVVEHEIKRVHELVNALLEALRPPRNASQTADAAHVIAEVMPLFTTRARLARVEFDAQPLSEPVQVALSAQLLRQAMLNLVDRAVRLAAAGGKVSLHCDAAGGGVDVVLTAQPSPDQQDGAEEVAGTRGKAAASPAPEDAIVVARTLAERAGGSIEIERGDANSPDRVAVHLPRATAS